MGQVNIRVPDNKVESVRARLKDMAASLRISQGDLLERAIDGVAGSLSAEPNKLLNTQIEELLDLARGLPEEIETIVDAVMQRKIDERAANRSTNHVDSALASGVQVGAADLPKNAQCAHCPAKFAGSKYASVCPACRDAGHQGDPRNCGACGEGTSI